MSVKLLKWFEIGNQGALVPTAPRERRLNPDLGEMKADGDGVREVKGRDPKVLVNGRRADLRIPSPISVVDRNGGGRLRKTEVGMRRRAREDAVAVIPFLNCAIEFWAVIYQKPSV